MTTTDVPTLAEASRAIAAGTLSPVDLVDAALARIDEHDPSLFAFIALTADRARAAAVAAEREIRAGRRIGPLHGIPFGLKDLYDVAGVRTTAHSHVLVDNVATADSDATERLERAGMILLGKLATHEFALGAPNNELPFPCARNPWNTDHFAGGSSSGSGVAVAAGMLPLAMGTDTGGSVRLPAAYCGIVGLKPTYGRLSRRGIVPLSQSLDHAGPLTRTVEDCAMAMAVLAGHDPLDPSCASVPVSDYVAALGQGVAGKRIGYARAFNAEALIEPEEVAALEAALAVFERLGAEIVDVTLPSLEHLGAVMWSICSAEQFAIHQQDLRAHPHKYARVTRERLMIGAFVTGAEVAQAQRLRRVMTAEIDAVLSECDAILCAPIPAAAPALKDVDDGPWRKAQPITSGFNVSGHPGLCIPSGFAANGLPLSLQLVGKLFDEATLMAIGHAYEIEAGWHLKRPFKG
jgi:aspartyl-tRNA(Asn)/glutamyl-tRNA(Gln) amidotransferase subunit A